MRLAAEPVAVVRWAMATILYSFRPSLFASPRTIVIDEAGIAVRDGAADERRVPWGDITEVHIEPGTVGDEDKRRWLAHLRVAGGRPVTLDSINVRGAADFEDKSDEFLAALCGYPPGARIALVTLCASASERGAACLRPGGSRSFSPGHRHLRERRGDRRARSTKRSSALCPSPHWAASAFSCSAGEAGRCLTTRPASSSISRCR